MKENALFPFEYGRPQSDPVRSPSLTLSPTPRPILPSTPRDVERTAANVRRTVANVGQTIENVRRIAENDDANGGVLRQMEEILRQTTEILGGVEVDGAVGGRQEQCSYGWGGS